MKLQIHFPKGPAAKELQLPLWDSSRIFQVESRGEMHGVVEIFEFLCPTAPLMTLMTIGFDGFAKDQDLPLGSNAERLKIFGHGG